MDNDPNSSDRRDDLAAIRELLQRLEEIATGAAVLQDKARHSLPPPMTLAERLNMVAESERALASLGQAPLPPPSMLPEPVESRAEQHRALVPRIEAAIVGLPESARLSEKGRARLAVVASFVAGAGVALVGAMLVAGNGGLPKPARAPVEAERTAMVSVPATMVISVPAIRAVEALEPKRAMAVQQIGAAQQPGEALPSVPDARREKTEVTRTDEYAGEQGQAAAAPEASMPASLAVPTLSSGSRIVLHGSQRVRLPISVNAGLHSLDVLLFVTKGLPVQVSLSEGMMFGEGTWLMPAGAIEKAELTAEPGASGAHDLEFELYSADGRVLARAEARLIVAANGVAAGNIDTTKK